MSYAFAATCLQGSREFDLNSIFYSLRSTWGIRINADNEDYFEEPYLARFSIDDTLLLMKYVDHQVPQKEIMLKCSKAEYGDEFTKAAANHVSHVAVAAVTQGNPVSAAISLAKITSCIMSEPFAIAVCTPGKIIEAGAYIHETLFLKEDYLPIYNFINVSLKEENGFVSAFTTGLKDFGKPELEIVDTSEDADAVEFRLYNIAYYVIDSDKELMDAETLTLQEQDEDGNTMNREFELKYDEGTNIKGKTVKIIDKVM